MGSTPNLGLYKGTPGSTTETFNIQTMLNDNWDKIDEYIQKKIIVSVTVPSTPTDDDFWLDISTTPNMLKRYDAANTSWIDIGAILATDISIQDAEGHFTADDVEGALHELFTNVSDGKTSIASAITDMGQAASGGETFANLAIKIRDISDDATALIGDVLATKTFYQGGTKKTGIIPSKGVATITPSTVNQTIAAGQYLNGDQTILGDPDLVSANIKAGANIFGIAGKTEVIDTTSVTGAVAGDVLSGKELFINGNKIVGNMPNYSGMAKVGYTSRMNNGAIEIDIGYPGYYGSTSKVTYPEPDLIAANVKKGVSIFGVTGNKLEYGIGDYVYVGTVQKLLTASTSGARYAKPMIGGDSYFFTVGYGGAKKLRWSDLAAVWTFGTSSGNEPFGFSLDSSNNLYFDQYFTVYSLNANGTLKWSRSDISSLSYPPSGTFYVASLHKVFVICGTTLYKLNADTGVTEASYSVVGTAFSGNSNEMSAYNPNDGYVYVIVRGATSNQLVKLSLTGDVLWQKTTVANDVRFLYLDSLNGYLYVGHYNNSIVKLDLDGNIIWTRQDGTASIYGLYIDTEGYLLSAESGKIAKRRVSDGSIIWSEPSTAFSVLDQPESTAGVKCGIYFADHFTSSGNYKLKLQVKHQILAQY